MQFLALLSLLPLLVVAAPEAAPEPYHPFFPATFHRPTSASDKRQVRQFDSEFLKEAHAATHHDGANIEPIRKRSVAQVSRAELEHAGDFLREAHKATHHTGDNIEPSKRENGFKHIRQVAHRQVKDESWVEFLREAHEATAHHGANVEPVKRAEGLSPDFLREAHEATSHHGDNVEPKRKVARKVKRAGTCTTKSSTATTSTIGGGLIAHPSSSTAAPTTTAARSSTTAATPAPTAYTVDPYGNGPFSGWGTWFDVGLSACGTYDTPGMPIVAISEELFNQWPGYDGTNPNNNPICGLHLDITWGGKTLTVEATDVCPGCAVRSLDMSKGAFEYFADLGVGLLGMDDYTKNITWSWTSGSGRLPELPYTP